MTDIYIYIYMDHTAMKQDTIALAMTALNIEQNSHSKQLNAVLQQCLKYSLLLYALIE